MWHFLSVTSKPLLLNMDDMNCPALPLEENVPLNKDQNVAITVITVVVS